MVLLVQPELLYLLTVLLVALVLLGFVLLCIYCDRQRWQSIPTPSNVNWRIDSDSLFVHNLA